MDFPQKWVVRPLFGLAAVAAAVAFFFLNQNLAPLALSWAWGAAYLVLAALAVQALLFVCEACLRMHTQLGRG